LYFVDPAAQVLPTDYNNIMSLTDAELRKVTQRQLVFLSNA
jgi:hypothetical protein